MHVPIAILVPRLIRRFGRNTVLVVGMIAGIVAMGWLSRAGAGSDYWIAVALPMILIGISQGLTLGPLTSSGVARVARDDAGAAYGAVNVAHQMGSWVGLSFSSRRRPLDRQTSAAPTLPPTAYRTHSTPQR